MFIPWGSRPKKGGLFFSGGEKTAPCKGGNEKTVAPGSSGGERKVEGHRRRGQDSFHIKRGYCAPKNNVVDHLKSAPALEGIFKRAPEPLEMAIY